MNKKFSFLFLIFSNLYSSEKLSIVEASREVQELLGRSTINSYHGESARKLQNVLRRHHIQAREVSSDVASRFFRDDFGHANIKVGEGINAFAAPGIVGVTLAGPIGLAIFAGALLIGQFSKPDPVGYVPTFREKWAHSMMVSDRFFVDLQKARGKFRHLFSDSQIEASMLKFEDENVQDNQLLCDNLKYELTEQRPSPNQKYQAAKELMPDLNGLICTWRQDFIRANINPEAFNYYPYTDRQEPRDLVIFPDSILEMIKFKTDKDSPLGFRIRSLMNFAIYIYNNGHFHGNDRLKDEVFNLIKEIKRIDGWFNMFVTAHSSGIQCGPECPGISGAEEMSIKKCDIVFSALDVLLNELYYC